MASYILKLFIGLAIVNNFDTNIKAAPLNGSVLQEEAIDFEAAAAAAPKTELGSVPVEISPANSNANILVQQGDDEAYVEMLQERDHEVKTRFAETEIESVVKRQAVESMEDQEDKRDGDEDDDMPGQKSAQSETEQVVDSQVVDKEDDANLKTGPETPDAMLVEAQMQSEVEDVSNVGENFKKINEDFKAEDVKGEMPAGADFPIEEDPNFEQDKNEKIDEDSEPPLSNRILDPGIPFVDLEDPTIPQSDDDAEPQKTHGIPLVYGAATLVRPIPKYEGDQQARSDNDDDDDGFVKVDDVILLKDSVITSVLEAEVVTDGFDCSQNRGVLRHMAAESKYFVDAARLYNFREAREVCSKYNLVIAEIEGLGDHRTLGGFMPAGSRGGGGGGFFIGLNDVKTEGVFRHANGKNVTYQNFLPSQPDDMNENEDCVTITKEKEDGPAGAADYDCNKTAHVFCMFRVDTQCYNESKETIENRKLNNERGLHLLVNATERAYLVSNYQATWKEAMKQCEAKQMKVFDMDGVVTMGFFRSILRWEKSFFRVKMPTVQYWTSGKFQKSHMTAPIVWHTKPELTDSEERGVEKHNSTFSFSGLYHWSTQKKRDPGGPHGWRRDLCVSFGFDSDPEAVPFIKNTNCDLPNYFICYAEYPESSDENGGEETTTTEGPTEVPFGPGDKPFPPDPVNDTEIEEIEKEMENEGRFLNVSECGTKDEDTVAGRNGIVGERYKWTYSDGFVVYINPSYSKNARKLINAAMDKLRKVVCIPFSLFRRNQRPYGNYVHIQNNGPRTCQAEVGRLGRGGQLMSLGDRCLSLGTIMHEMIHALGFWHEQSRPDRDKYVTILWNNIHQNLRYNFVKFEGTLTYGVAYNPISIMHYEANAFSSNGRPTIVAKNGGPVGSRHVLQQTDIDKLRKMYKCD